MMATETETTETTTIIWQAKGRYEYGFSHTESLITLSVRHSPKIMPSGEWKVTLAYNYVGERENTFTAWSRREAVKVFAEWVNQCDAFPVEVQQ
jgi:hypothetical protein